MANLILPRRFTQQPQYPVEKDVNNPLSRELTNVYLPTRRDKPVILSGNAAFAPSPTGMAYSTGAAGIINIQDSASWTFPDTQRLTMAFVGRINAVDSPYGGLFVKRKAANNEFGPMLQRDNTNDLFRVYNGTGYAAWTNLTISSLIGKDIVMVVTLSAASANTTSKVYVNGILRDTVNIASWISTNSTGDLIIGGEQTASTNYGSNVDFSLLSVWNGKVLNDAEISEFSRNPWQIFRRSPQILYFDTAGGGATDAVGSGTAVVTSSIIGASQHASVGSGNAIVTFSGVGNALVPAVASGDVVVTSSLVGSSSITGVAAGDVVATAAIVGSSLASAVVTGNEVTTSAFTGSSLANALASGNVVVTSDIVGTSVGGSQAVLSGNAVVTSSIVGSSLFNGAIAGSAVVTATFGGASLVSGAALGNAVVEASFVGTEGVTAGATSGSIVVTAAFASFVESLSSAGGGGGKSKVEPWESKWERKRKFEDELFEPKVMKPVARLDPITEEIIPAKRGYEVAQKLLPKASPVRVRKARPSEYDLEEEELLLLL